MEFRHSMDDLPREIETAAFCELVRAGQVKPTALYRTKWTNNEWRTVDNFPPFHPYSPVKHPPGSYLAAEMEAEERNIREAEMMWRVWRAYHGGGLIERILGLPSLDKILHDSACSGAARLYSFIEEGPSDDSLVTLRFTPVCLEIEVLSGLTSLRGTISRFVGDQIANGRPATPEKVPFDRALIRESRADVKYVGVPDLFRSWSHFSGTLRPLESCEPVECIVLDGVAYRHQLLDDGGLVDVQWINPVEPAFAAQDAVVRAYDDLLAGADL